MNTNYRPRISVIIPAYNEEKYINTSINALLHQTYPVEIIVVDNGSTDRTFEIASSFQNVIVVRENKKGVQFARERGRVEATGDIIANLDADCIPPKDWVEKAIKYFKNSKVVAVGGPYTYHDGSLFLRFFTKTAQFAVYKILHIIIHYVFHRGAILIFGNVFTKRDALEKIGGYNTEIEFFGDDTDFGMRLTKVGRVLFVHELSIDSSSRRFKHSGVLKVSWQYVANHIWMLFFRRPFHGGVHRME